MRSNSIKRLTSLLLCVPIAAGLAVTTISASAAALQDDYEIGFEENGTTYQSLHILEDQYDLIEPINNLYPVISPNSLHDTHSLFKGSYEQIEAYFRQNGMSDGLPIVPPTKIKAEKFMGYSNYGFDQEVAVVNGRSVKAYQVAANAIMAGCSPEYTPVCIAFTQALSDSKYLNSLRSGRLTPMMYVNGPIARQIGIDCAQGMTTEECNISIARFMELALINLAGIERNRTNNFGNVQPLVFSENDEVCLSIGWQPHHVEKGYDLNDNVITAASFAMWGNNITPATDLPEEIMKVMAWDITEKNLGGLGGQSVDDNANTHRTIFITESVATALAAKYKSKDALESALVENARRPLWMRAYAYYYANTGGALTKSFDEVYNELKAAQKEDAKTTASPAWMSGITYSNIDTVATMTKGNTEIIITGDSSRNKTQVMPGGVSVMKEITVSENWDNLVTSVNYFPSGDFNLTLKNEKITPPEAVPSVLVDGTYRIYDKMLLTGGRTLGKSCVCFDSSTNTLRYYLNNASAEESITLDPVIDAAFIDYLNNLGFNSSFTVENGKFKDFIIRFPSNASKMNNNTVALTKESFEGIGVTLHAYNKTYSSDHKAGNSANNGSTVVMSDTVTGFNVNLNGDLEISEQEEPFVTLNGTKVTVNPNVGTGATAIIGAKNDDNTYRTMTFENTGDGTYKITYNTSNTLDNATSSVYLRGFGGEDEAFGKTDNKDVVTLTKVLEAGNYEFTVFDNTSDKEYGSSSEIIDTVYRLGLTESGSACRMMCNGGTYEFKYELSSKKLSVYHTADTAAEVRRIFTGHSLTLSGDIVVNFFLDLADVENAADTTVSFRWQGINEHELNNVPVQPVSGTTGLYMVQCPVAVAEMTSNIIAVASNSGSDIAVDSYSVKQYTDTILTSADFKRSFNGDYGKLQTLVKAMLDFGAKAQNQFNVNKNNLATMGLQIKSERVNTDDVPAKKAVTNESALAECGLEYAGTSVVYLSEMTLRHYFKVTDENKFDRIRNAVTFDRSDTESPASAVCVNRPDYICFDYANIGAADLDTAYTLSIGEYKLQFSVLDYSRQVMSAGYTSDTEIALAKAVYLYNKAANDYLGE